MSLATWASFSTSYPDTNGGPSGPHGGLRSAFHWIAVFWNALVKLRTTNQHFERHQRVASAKALDPNATHTERLEKRQLNKSLERDCRRSKLKEAPQRRPSLKQCRSNLHAHTTAPLTLRNKDGVLAFSSFWDGIGKWEFLHELLSLSCARAKPSITPVNDRLRFFLRNFGSRSILSVCCTNRY